MITLSQLALFSAASLLLIFTPGPDIIYVMTRGMAQGRGAALAAAAGFSLGNLVHTFFAVVGLSALLTSSATAFQLVKYAGAVYLVYLGIKMLRSGSPVSVPGAAPTLQNGVIFRQSIIANILNPKVAVFFLAFFPQFVDHSRGHAAWQMLTLGCTFVVLTAIGFGLVGICSGWIGGFLQRAPRIGSRIGHFAGGILIALGLRLAWPERG
ncbi:lysine transporter LysE [Desulfuromonas versatilis]|uniref:Lysine transporter LysE n=1 Tax=Desulfuromonas versatilis TaxID=2802975 RepID=A0ABM8HUY4_9BACT|nr:LysE family translocator [Desulfuromonas versatilis]BCR04320.1 lysine transporter LysE [Desulfuromonas versatilis]